MCTVIICYVYVFNHLSIIIKHHNHSQVTIYLKTGNPMYLQKTALIIIENGITVIFEIRVILTAAGCNQPLIIRAIRSLKVVTLLICYLSKLIPHYLFCVKLLRIDLRIDRSHVHPAIKNASPSSFVAFFVAGSIESLLCPRAHYVLHNVY